MLHKNLAGSSKHEFFIEQLVHLRLNVNDVGCGSGSYEEQKLQDF